MVLTGIIKKRNSGYFGSGLYQLGLPALSSFKTIYFFVSFLETFDLMLDVGFLLIRSHKPGFSNSIYF